MRLSDMPRDEADAFVRRNPDYQGEDIIPAATPPKPPVPATEALDALRTAMGTLGNEAITVLAGLRAAGFDVVALPARAAGDDAARLRSALQAIVDKVPERAVSTAMWQIYEIAGAALAASPDSAPAGLLNEVKRLNEEAEEAAQRCCDDSCHNGGCIATGCDHTCHGPRFHALFAPPRPDPWAELLAEARAFGEWYAPTTMSVNGWVGVDTFSGLYGGWSVEGDHLGDEWDESEMMTATGDTPEEVIADLIRIARRYRERRDAERAEWAADDAATPASTTGPAAPTPATDAAARGQGQ